jgi:hypothetical protein
LLVVSQLDPSYLRVEEPGIIVYDSRRLLVDVLLERLSAKERHVGLSIERPIEVDASSCLNFARCSFDNIIGKTVECA